MQSMASHDERVTARHRLRYEVRGSNSTSMPHNHSPLLTALRARLASHAFDLAAVRVQLLLRKANFNPAQPRVPARQPGGGQWTGRQDGGQVHLTQGRRGFDPSQR